MRRYLAALAFVTLCGVAPHGALDQGKPPSGSTAQRPPTAPTQPEPEPTEPDAAQPTVPPATAQPGLPAPGPVTPVVPAPQPAVPIAPALVGRIFGSDAGMIWNPIKPTRTLDFEMVMGRLKEALALSEDPVRKQQAAGWKVFKAVEVGPNNSVLYVFVMDPAVKGADYTVSKVLNEAFPTEVQELYKLFTTSYASGQVLLNLQLVENLGAAPLAPDAHDVFPTKETIVPKDPDDTIVPTDPTDTIVPKDPDDAVEPKETNDAKEPTNTQAPKERKVTKDKK